MKDREKWEILGRHDASVLEEKERTYQGSWKKRGGVGAFMMLARKWDRLESICREHNYDIFAALEASDGERDGSARAEVRDLRRYLMLVDAETAPVPEPVSTETIVMRARTMMDQPFGYDVLIEEGIFWPETGQMVDFIGRDQLPVMEHVRVPVGSLRGQNLLSLYMIDHATGNAHMKMEHREEYAKKG